MEIGGLVIGRRQWVELILVTVLAVVIISAAFMAAFFVKDGKLSQVEEVPDVRLLYTELMDRYMLNLKPETFRWYLMDEGDVRAVTSGGLPKYGDAMPEIAAVNLEQIRVVFSTKPSSYTVSYKPAGTDEEFVTVEPTGSTIYLPVSGNFEVCVDAKWHNANGTHFDGVASYTFVTESYQDYNAMFDLAQTDSNEIELGKPEIQ